MTIKTWERRTEWPLAVVAFAFLIAFAWPILDQGLSPTGQTVCDAIQIGAWVTFVIDYAARLVLSEDRGQFFRSHLVDLAVIALPLLRPLRLLRLITILSVLNRGVSSGLRGRVAVYVVGATVLVVLVGGLAMLDAERGQDGANIQTPGDAWWWAISTVTTVGYGDRYPVTASGRFVAVTLMVCGIALIGVVTASLASWLIERIRDEQTETRDDMADLLAEVRQLRTDVAAQQGHYLLETGTKDSTRSHARDSEAEVSQGGCLL